MLKLRIQTTTQHAVSPSNKRDAKYNHQIDPTKESLLSFHMLSDLRNYPEYTNCNCWWCCHSFKSHPIGLPKKIDGDIILCIGMFCSFSCLLAFVKEGGELVGKCTPTSVYYMYKLLTGDNKKNLITDPICIAPPRYTLKIFGGKLTITQFRENICTYETFLAPMVPLSMIYHAKEIDEYNSKQSCQQSLSVSTETKSPPKLINKCAGCIAANVISMKKKKTNDLMSLDKPRPTPSNQPSAAQMQYINSLFEFMDEDE